MSIHHAQSGEPIPVTPFGDDLSHQHTVALFKSAQLEVMRLVLPAGKSMPAHQLSGEVTIQCVEGLLNIEVDGQATLLEAGHLMFLLGRVPHSVTALEDASALVTIALHP